LIRASHPDQLLFFRLLLELPKDTQFQRHALAWEIELLLTYFFTASVDLPVVVQTNLG
jgi:hypothetical protein